MGRRIQIQNVVRQEIIQAGESVSGLWIVRGSDKEITDEDRSII